MLFDAQKNDLKGRLPKPVPPNPHVPSPVFASLLDDVQTQARAFFDNHLQKQTPRLQPAAGFLDAAISTCCSHPLKCPSDTRPDRRKLKQNEDQRESTSSERDETRPQAFLPFLQQRLIRQFIVQTMTAQTGADPVLVESLLTDERLLGWPPAVAGRVRRHRRTRASAPTFFASADGIGRAAGHASLCRCRHRR